MEMHECSAHTRTVLHPRKVAFASNLDFFFSIRPKREIRVRVTGSNIGFLRKLR